MQAAPRLRCRGRAVGWVGSLVLLAAFAAPEPARAGAPAPPPPWAHAGPTPEKFTRTVENGLRQEVWAQDGQLDGPAVVFNNAGAKVRDEFYERGRCWR